MTILIVIIIFLIYSSIILQLTKSELKSDNTPLSEISIIIAAKNEEGNADRLINSLTKLEYDPSKFEIIIIDDQSTDHTFSKISALINDYSNFRLYRANNTKYVGKRGALQFGIEKAKFNNIVITDADCRVKSGLLKEYSSKFHCGNDFVFGVAPYKQFNNLINKIASFDNLWVHILTFSFAEIGLPYSSSARSFGFRKDSFIKIEGYKNTNETLSGDDDLLLREAVKFRMKIGTITDPDAFVFTNSKLTLKEHIRQKSRHTSTSTHYLVKNQIVLGIWHFINLVMIFSPLLAFYNAIYLLLFSIKFFSDIFIIKLLMKKFGYKFNIIEIIYLQIIYELLIIVYFIRSIAMKNKW